MSRLSFALGVLVLPFGLFSIQAQPLGAPGTATVSGIVTRYHGWPLFSSGCASEQGEFTISDLDPGHYWIRPKLPDENLYVKAITAPSNVPAGSGAPQSPDRHVSRLQLTLKPGEKQEAMIVTVAEGGASMRGKVVAEKEDARAMQGLLAHLIPADPNAADDLLRYSESLVQTDGSFSFNQIAPGKYWLITRVAPDDDPSERPVSPLAWDANKRKQLRREAAAAKNEIEFKAYQRVKDQVLRR